jgi:LmbE family N-acetylglucosaminyl deacetylase
MNILAFGAHPDDVEIFCAGTLLKYAAAGHKIFIALATSGNQGSNVIEGREEIARIREKEQLEAAKLYDAQVRFLRYDDEGLIYNEEVRRNVLNAVRWADPDVVFTHFPGDMSTDHNTIATIVSRIMLSLPGKNVKADLPPIKKSPSLFYWDTAAGIHFDPEVYVDITEVMEKKLQGLSFHKTQFEWMGTFGTQNLADLCRIISEYRGLQSGFRFAEGFRAFRVHGYMPNFKLLP